MTYIFFRAASHSAFSDMSTITQESSSKVFTASEPKRETERLQSIEDDMRTITFEDALDDFTFDHGFRSAGFSSKPRNDEIIILTEPELPKRAVPRQSSAPISNKTTPEGDAQKKFGSAKAISSDQYFRDSNNDDNVSFLFHYYFIPENFIFPLIDVFKSYLTLNTYSYNIV